MTGKQLTILDTIEAHRRKEKGIRQAVTHADAVHEGEIFKPIIGYEGYYSISNYGRVLSHSRVTPRNIYLPSTIKAIESKKRYPCVHLCKNGKKQKAYIHRLVAIHFIPNPLNKEEVNHIDSNNSNSIVSNLEWVTPSENMKHCSKAGRCSIKDVAHLSWAKIRRKVIQKTISGDTVKIWDSITEAANEINTSTGEICDVLKGRQRTCHGFKWEYAD